MVMGMKEEDLAGVVLRPSAAQVTAIANTSGCRSKAHSCRCEGGRTTTTTMDVQDMMDNCVNQS